MKRPAFTLIELLVVIAIIGLLATFSVVQLAGAREKARIARSVGFEGTVNRSIGSEAVGIYNLEEGTGGSGSTITDTSGLNNNMTITTGGTSWSQDTYDAKASAYSLTFSGTDLLLSSRGYGIANKNFTVMHWIKTTSSIHQQYTVWNAGGPSGFRFGISGGYVQFLIGNSGGHLESSCASPRIDDGKWHHIAGVFDRTGGSFICYVDGRKTGRIAMSYFADMYDGPVYVGYYSTPFNGQLDNVRIFASQLDGLSIKSLYDKEKEGFIASE